MLSIDTTFWTFAALFFSECTLNTNIKNLSLNFVKNVLASQIRSIYNILGGKPKVLPAHKDDDLDRVFF